MSNLKIADSKCELKKIKSSKIAHVAGVTIVEIDHGVYSGQNHSVPFLKGLAIFIDRYKERNHIS